MNSSWMLEAVTFLAAAVVAVPLSKRLGLGAVVGYLGAGMLIGPRLLGLVSDIDRILHVAELGVVLLLFVIGLELQPSRLWALRRPVFGLGGAQLLATSVILGGVALLFGLPPAAALIVGLSLSLSSTALALKILAEKKQLTSHYGRSAFAILLFQDLAATAQSHEVFVAATLLVVVGTALFMQQLGLFFIAVGMSDDLRLVAQQPLIIVGLTVGLMVVKALILYALARFNRCDHGSAVNLALVISQGGEFAFVLFGVAAGANILDQTVADTLVVVVSLSMVLTPLLVSLNERWLKIGHEAAAPRAFDPIYPLAEAQEMVRLFRQHDEDLLARQHKIHEDEAQLIAASKAGAAELERLFNEDQRWSAK